MTSKLVNEMPLHKLIIQINVYSDNVLTNKALIWDYYKIVIRQGCMYLKCMRTILNEQQISYYLLRILLNPLKTKMKKKTTQMREESGRNMFFLIFARQGYDPFSPLPLGGLRKFF